MPSPPDKDHEVDVEGSPCYTLGAGPCHIPWPAPPGHKQAAHCPAYKELDDHQDRPTCLSRSCFPNLSSKQARYRHMQPPSDQLEDELDSDSVCTLGEPVKSKSTSEILGGSAAPGFQQRSHAAL